MANPVMTKKEEEELKIKSEKRKKLDQLRAELEELELEDIGEHKIVYELEPVYKDPKKGGDPTFKPKKEYYPDEGKCIFCGFDMREYLSLPPHESLPGGEKLTLEEKQILDAEMRRHVAEFDNGEGIPAGHETLMKLRVVGRVPAGNNPNRLVQNLAGVTLTAAQRDKQVEKIDALMEKGRQEYKREV